MSKVVIHRNAAKYLKRLPDESRSRIKGLLKELERGPLDQPGIKRMLGEWAGILQVAGRKISHRLLVQ
jgi:mRNA interferase RelE/StbE